MGRPQKMSQEDRDFDSALEMFRVKVEEAFCDNINSQEVFSQVDEAMKLTNTYLKSKERKVPLMEKAYRLTRESLQAMGLTYEDGSEAGSSRTASLITALAKFRDEVRINSKNTPEAIHEACRRFKEEELPALDILVE